MKGILVQIFVSLIISIGSVLVGYVLTWPSTAFEFLESDLSPIGHRISEYEGSLIGSINMVGFLFSSTFTGWISDFMGRKRCFMLIALCFALGWAILNLANSLTILLVSRFILGLACGANFNVLMPFVNEISSKSMRGPLISLQIFIFKIGVVGGYVAGWQMSYQAVIQLGLGLSFALFTLLWLVKESPHYLILKSDDKEALNSIKHYRGVKHTTQEVLDEFICLQNKVSLLNKYTDSQTCTQTQVSERQHLRRRDLNDTKEMNVWIFLCTSKSTKTALFVTSVNNCFMTLNGTLGIITYAGPMFSKGAPGVSQHTCSVLIGVACILGSLLAIVANVHMGRRTQHICSAVLSSVLLALMATMVRWRWAPEWMVPATLMAYCCAFHLGAANIPIIQSVEICSPRTMSALMAITTVVVSIGNFITTAIFYPSVSFLGLECTFLMFSIESIFMATFAYFFMRETKGKSFDEIMKSYDNGFLNR